MWSPFAVLLSVLRFKKNWSETTQCFLLLFKCAFFATFLIPGNPLFFTAQSRAWEGCPWGTNAPHPVLKGNDYHLEGNSTVIVCMYTSYLPETKCRNLTHHARAPAEYRQCMSEGKRRVDLFSEKSSRASFLDRCPASDCFFVLNP